MAKRKKPSKEDDSALWRHVSRTVAAKPDWENSHTRFLPAMEQLMDQATSQAIQPLKSKRKPVPGTPAKPARPVAKTAEPLIHGVTAGLDKRTAQRLKKGRLPIEARLDLHGHSQEQAFRALHGFIDGQWAAGRRCVLVVTGKGKGVLKDAVPRWLNEPLLRMKILSFTYAQRQDGGEGALYILLKRARGGLP